MKLILIVAGFVVAAIGGFFWYSSSQISIGVVPAEIEIAVNTSDTFEAVLFYKPWFSSTLKRTRGTVTARSGSPSVVTVTPTVPTKTGHQVPVVFTVGGAAVSNSPATIYVNGSSLRHGNPEAATVKVIVGAP